MSPSLLSAFSVLLFATSFFLPIKAAAPSYNFTQEAINNGDALAQLAAQALANSKELHQRSGAFANSTCTPDKVRVRREWRTLPAEQRRAFVAAIECMQSSPSLYEPGVMPAAKTLYDDFVAIHLKQTPVIHRTANFQLWHRLYTDVFEQKVRECGYTGTFPFWEWGHDAEDPALSPLFDGSDTSIGSNGAFVPHEGLEIHQAYTKVTLKLEPGSGGGYVMSGPFSKMTVNLPVVQNTDTPLATDPRYLQRDLNKHVSSRHTTFRNTTLLLTKHNTLESFWGFLNSDDRYINPFELGVHAASHWQLGGDSGNNFFISPADPAFFLHHSQIDRIYWIWQMLDWENRQDIFGTVTMQNIPPSRNGTLDDLVDLRPLAEPRKLRDLMSTIGIGGSPFCYVYEG
ncbi:tyrosinase central domain-containing protein [Colletotrichum cuscutae]|uniref:Tyrosinase central domain-containing protein n=1 Tax=Colletotrichum cuscutae TaxID=1209917 RepID=A0AAI9XVQ5_9PEZI|nr:tyrosinase central domain-containing protein [Colletotrichum cuscutae]